MEARLRKLCDTAVLGVIARANSSWRYHTTTSSSSAVVHVRVSRDRDLTWWEEASDIFIPLFCSDGIISAAVNSVSFFSRSRLLVFRS